MELPVINHEDYFAKIGDDHKFPIQKFGTLANYLTSNDIVKKFYTQMIENLDSCVDNKPIRTLKN